MVPVVGFFGGFCGEFLFVFLCWCVRAQTCIRACVWNAKHITTTRKNNNKRTLEALADRGPRHVDLAALGDDVGHLDLLAGRVAGHLGGVLELRGFCWGERCFVFWLNACVVMQVRT
jgi:hypothetical protein